MIPTENKVNDFENPNGEVNLTFYLNHFNKDTIDYVLEECGYDSLPEYEDKCRDSDLFPVTIGLNGLLVNERPDVDEDEFRVFELSIHNLKSNVRNHLFKHYFSVTQLDFELLYGELNDIFIVVPYSDDYDWDESECE
jgi:hypothetical protein